MPVPAKITITRMVHWENVEHILTNGFCCRLHSNYDPDYVEIGMSSLIGDRHVHPVPIDGHGDLGEYVPFYFAGHSPMLYLIKNGYSGVPKRPQEDIVFFICDAQTVINTGVEYVFTDRNAKIAVANFYNNPQDFDKLDWDVIKAKKWADTPNDLSRRDRKQAEFLVRNLLPVSCIQIIVVKTTERKDYFVQMISNLGLSIQVFVDTKCKLYY
jgi:ssDNA thymidine ADP-ribosyltransferase, DarT